ncbi:MAG: hypothetical protein ACYS5V_17545 [Planctomycetota bacterium]|jgi:hypothetical protein
MSRRGALRVTAAVVVCVSVQAATADGDGLEIRRIRPQGLALAGRAVPREAVRVFAYEGEPKSVRVGKAGIGVDYGLTGVLFDRKTGRFVRRWTIVDGWPERRPEGFAPAAKRRRGHLVGPGVMYGVRWPGFPRGSRPARAVVAEITHGGRIWRACQPVRFLDTLRRRVASDWRELRSRYGAWTPILRKLNKESYLEAAPADGVGQAARYTTADGLASNIVTHLAVADGRLWAACVDIYDPRNKRWGPGGLCRFDAKAGRWRRVQKIDGVEPRWVTLLQAVGDTLWVGFREGEGVAGDKVSYGMGLYPGWYRPVTKRVVLARLAGGKWRTFARQPLPDERSPKAPTETPRTLAVRGQRVFVFSETFVRSF